MRFEKLDGVAYVTTTRRERILVGALFFALGVGLGLLGLHLLGI